jgi:hypothetical protein
MKKTTKFSIAAVLLISYMLMIMVLVKGEPVGGSVTNISTTQYQVAAQSRSDEGGTITTINVDATQQNYGWKAYVGNISGTLVLDDAAGKSVYEWSLTALTGEILVTRASGITWTSLSCADTSVITSEETTLNMGGTAIDNIQNTFADTTHNTFTIAGTALDNCPTAYPYVNDTSQAADLSSIYQEILINDTAGNLIYVGNLEIDPIGYDEVNTYDFQLIVPDNTAANNQTTYYFYVELDS